METDSKTILARTLEATFPAEEKRLPLATLLEPVELSTWFDTIDNSPYALDDWLRALAEFIDWLEGEGIETRPADSMIGYLECCTLSVASTLSLPDFASMTRENLDRYGFDAARPASKEPDSDGSA